MKIQFVAREIILQIACSIWDGKLESSRTHALYVQHNSEPPKRQDGRKNLVSKKELKL